MKVGNLTLKTSNGVNHLHNHVGDTIFLWLLTCKCTERPIIEFPDAKKSKSDAARRSQT